MTEIIDFIVHDADGRILRKGTAPSTMVSIQAGVGEHAIEAVGDDVAQYVSDGVVTDKPPMPITIDKTTVSADGVDVVTIAGVPVGAICKIASMAEAVVNDGTIELSFDSIGDFMVTISAFPYLDYEVMVSAT